MEAVLSSLRGYKICIVLFGLLFFSIIITPDTRAQSKKITWYSMAEAQELARENNKKVVIFAEATWCVYCKKMKKKVFPEPSVVDSMKAYFYPVILDIESNKVIQFNQKEMTQREFAQSTGMQATPTFFFLDKEGNKLGAQPGFIPAKTFRQLLGYIGSGAFQQMEFQVYLKKHTAN